MHRYGMIALPAEERWVHTARHFAASLLARWGLPGLAPGRLRYGDGPARARE
ncbi:hypothetical protein ACFY8B_28900 [Streptomyces sp. NPDC012751]|uniref:hypothetical protein n=1 Tax=Streptomyces sp. NPDC012751 TaxID=3364846 RepID=UPI0036B828E1